MLLKTTSPAPATSSHRPRQSRRPQDIDLAAEEARLQAKIAALQAQERRQRLIEDLEKPKRKMGGFRFIHAFLIVLGLHVAAVGGFYGVSSIRKMRIADKSALSSKAPSYAGVSQPQPTQAPGTGPATPVGSPDTGRQEAQKPPANRAKGLVKTPLATPKKSPPQSKAPSPEIRELFARRHGQKQALDANPTTKTPSLAAQNELPKDHGLAEQTHRVAPSETLAEIAKNHGIKTADLRKANGLDDSDDLQVGQKLKIPAADPNPPLQLVEQEAEASSLKSEEPEQFTPKLERLAPNGVYTVQRGENPYMVARKLGVSFTDLMTANSISNPADVSIGMKLKVPGRTLASN